MQPKSIQIVDMFFSPRNWHRVVFIACWLHLMLILPWIALWNIKWNLSKWWEDVVIFIYVIFDQPWLRSKWSCQPSMSTNILGMTSPSHSKTISVLYVPMGYLIIFFGSISFVLVKTYIYLCCQIAMVSPIFHLNVFHLIQRNL